MDKYDLSRDAADDTQREQLKDTELAVHEYHATSKKSTLSKRAFNNVYVKNFPKDPSFTEDSLMELFKEFGEVQSTAIMRDGNGESKGFGFVCFRDPAAAEKAIQFVMRSEAENDDDVEEKDGGKKKDSKAGSVKLTDLYVREAKKKSQRQAELAMSNFKYKKSIMFFSLFVKNFPVGTTAEELKIYFQTACQGEISRVNIIPGTQQAFVNFEKQDQCKMAKEFARNVLFKSQYALYVEYCYPREMRAIRNEEIHDKKAQDRKRNQQSQAQIASLNGSQNLIDLLTLLLKPAFQLNQGGGNNNMNQRRSYSTNVERQNVARNHGGYQGAGMHGGGQHGAHNMQRQPYRGNFQGQQYQQRQAGGNMVQGGVRHHSVNPAQANQMMANNQMLAQQQMMLQQVPPQPMVPTNMMQRPAPTNVQHGVSGGGSGSIDGGASSSMNSSSANQTGQPQYVDAQYANEYFLEIRNMFASEEYKKLTTRQQKKEVVGNTIYKHVEKLVGELRAPKITGMLIDLPEVELNYSITQWSEFEQKVMSAM